MNPAKATANNLNNYKTKICRHFQVGKCKLGEHCNFAHGGQDVKESKHTDSYNMNSNQDSSQYNAQQNSNTYDKVLLLENRMDATFNTQRLLLSQLKQLCQNNQSQRGSTRNQKVL